MLWWRPCSSSSWAVSARPFCCINGATTTAARLSGQSTPHGMGLTAILRLPRWEFPASLRRRARRVCRHLRTHSRRQWAAQSGSHDRLSVSGLSTQTEPIRAGNGKAVHEKRQPLSARRPRDWRGVMPTLLDTPMPTGHYHGLRRDLGDRNICRSLPIARIAVSDINSPNHGGEGAERPVSRWLRRSGTPTATPASMATIFS